METTTVTKNVRREFKSSLFCMIFQEKSELLSLYNAISGSRYEDPELLEITTIQDVLYMGIKNDLSFIIDEYMNLYEAQSTWNSNMPLRGLFYFSSLYQGYVERLRLDIYSPARLKLPTPRYVVFYNGLMKEPERQILRLSDSFERSGSENEGAVAIECIAEVYNINWGHNTGLLEQCRKLSEYAYLVAEVRNCLDRGFVLAAAVDRAVEVCIENGILADFLLKHRAEVKQMILTEYDEERHIKNVMELAREDGKKEGMQQGIEALILDNLENGTPRDQILTKLQKRFQVGESLAAEYYAKYMPKEDENIKL